jgi:hypothetical protein
MMANYWLSYPSSGLHMCKNVLDKLDIQIHSGHSMNIWESHWPLRHPDIFFLGLRDFTECIIRRAFEEFILERTLSDQQFITNKMIDDLFTKDKKVTKYIENIMLFELAGCTKFVVCYEDVKTQHRAAFYEIAEHFGKEEGLQNMDWNNCMDESLYKYNATMSDGNIHYYKYMIEDVDYFRDRMHSINPFIYNKYLKRYEN